MRNMAALNASDVFALVFKRPRTALAVCLSIFLSGCYEVDQQIITPEIAFEVPGLAGEIVSVPNDEKYILSFNGETMSYLSGEVKSDGSIKWSPETILIMPLRDQFFWFQSQTPEGKDEPSFLFLFKFDSEEKQLDGPYVPITIKDGYEEEFGLFARQYQVTVDRSGYGIKLDGSRDNIIAFLKAHADVPLKKRR